MNKSLYNKSYYAAHREEILAQHINYRISRKKMLVADERFRRLARKMDIFNAYGGPKCTCCGETLVDGLSIDHVAGDGAEKRKEMGDGGTRLYQWLKKNNYPPGYQVLCFTCNFAKGTDDHCPHEDLRIAWG